MTPAAPTIRTQSHQLYDSVADDPLIKLPTQELRLPTDLRLGLQLRDGCDKEIKKIPLSQRALLAFRHKIDGNFEQR